MDGTNAAGRKVSLLNDHEPRQHLVRLPSISPSLRSPSSSYSSPLGSPATPQLVRTNSCDSTNMQTPSPITPDFGLDGPFGQSLESPGYSQSTFFPQQQQKDLNSAYPPVPHTSGPLPYHPALAAQSAYYVQQPAPDQQGAQAAAAAAAANVRPKKNSYPCPLAKTYHCNDYFTTSGHAARHAKKHTGKKDAFCPECNKAFTRKDNMEQHRRTHQSGRNATKVGERDVKKAKQQAKRPKPALLQSTTPSLSQLSMVDPALPISPEGSFLAPAVQPADSFMDFNHHRNSYPDPTAFSMTYSYNNASSCGGLDALAIAASGEKRKFES